MRLTNIFIFAILFVSCHSAESDSADSVASTSANDTSRPVPSFVRQSLERELKGWQLATPDDWKIVGDDADRLFGFDYKLADINCDGAVDFTGYLKNATGQFGLYQIYSFDGNYLLTELQKFESLTLNVGIRYLDERKPFYHYDSSKSYYKCGAIEQFNFADKSRMLFYKDTAGASHVINVGG